MMLGSGGGEGWELWCRRYTNKLAGWLASKIRATEYNQ